jgi:hypothetical protein
MMNFIMRKLEYVLNRALFLVVLGTAELGAAGGNDYFKSDEFTKPLLSVELQYYRVPKANWELMLTRMAQYHANTISSYVCWSWHEYEEGKFDFNGTTIPERDLVGFIKLVEKHKMKLVLKPGPFIDAELNAGGVPAWMWEHYPETRAITRKGKVFLHGDSRMPRLSYLHPKYLERVAVYYQAFADAVAEYQYPNGPIIAVQVDNETPGDGMLESSWYLNWNFKADYNPYYTQILWPSWLEKKYGGIAKLNEAYGTSYGSFSEVAMPVKWTEPKNSRQFQVYLDLDEFGEFQAVEGLRRFTEMLRRSGIKVPFYQDLLCMPWDMAGLRADLGGMAEAVGGWLGTNNYAEIYRIGSQFVGNPIQGLNFDEYVHMGAWRVKLTGSLSRPYPAFVPEITVAGSRFYFQNPIAWGADAVNIYIGSQINPDNKLISPNRSWGMEACVMPSGKVRDCLYNGKVTYLFMEHSGAFMPDRERPELAIGYSHIPEHAWNWEYHWNFQRPDKIPKLKNLQNLVAGTNTGERTQLMARELIRRKVDFDVIHLDYLKPGELEQYKAVLIPSTPFGPVPDAGDSLGKKGGTYMLYLSPGNSDYRLEFFERQGVRLRQAWADAPEVDVVQRFRGMENPTALSIINRGAGEFNDEVYFNAGRSRLRAVVGGKNIGFVAVWKEGLKAAVIAHPLGRGEYRLGDDWLGFTGAFGGVAIEDGYALFSAPGAGMFFVRSKNLVSPERLIRLGLSGRAEEAVFQWNHGTLSFVYDPGAAGERTDMYIALGKGMSLEQAIGEYLGRTGLEMN